MTEGQLQVKVMAWLREQPGLWRKWSVSPFGQSGFPDIIGCFHGRFCAIELKHPDYGDHPERGLTLEQEHVRDEIIKNGGAYLCTNSLQEVKEWVRSL